MRADWDGRPFRGARLVLTCGAGILVLLRDDIPGIAWPGHWDLPGGTRDGGESPVQCALRELREETGLVLAAARLSGDVRPIPHKPNRVGWYFYGEITPAEAASAHLGDEGQVLRLMPVAEFIRHPKAIPHFRAIVAEHCGL